jgi:hypothetical protein
MHLKPCKHGRDHASSRCVPIRERAYSRGVSLVEGEHADTAKGRGRVGGGEGDDVAKALVVALGMRLILSTG